MALASRYGLVGIAALALLSGVHWLRSWQAEWHPAAAFLIGVMPNVAAALAIPFVVIGIWADQNKAAPPAAVRRWFFSAAMASTAGLVLWEVMQRTGSNLVFDPNDIAATLVGLVLAIGVFGLVTPPAR